MRRGQSVGGVARPGEKGRHKLRWGCCQVRRLEFRQNCKGNHGKILSGPYFFPGAAVRNCGLKQQKFTLSCTGGRKSTTKGPAGLCSLRGLSARVLPCLPQTLGAPGVPGSVASVLLSLPVFTRPSLSLCIRSPSPCSHKDTSRWMDGPSQTQDDHILRSA